MSEKNNTSLKANSTKSNCKTVLALCVFLLCALAFRSKENASTDSLIISKAALAEMRYGHELTDRLPTNSKVTSIALLGTAEGKVANCNNPGDLLETCAINLLRRADLNSKVFVDIKYRVVGGRGGHKGLAFVLKVQ